MNKNKITLEASTNTHIANGNITIVSKSQKMGTMSLRTEGQVIVEHGEHNTVATEKDSEHIIKIVQQEFSPLKKAYFNAFD